MCINRILSWCLWRLRAQSGCRLTKPILELSGNSSLRSIQFVCSHFWSAVSAHCAVMMLWITALVCSHAVSAQPSHWSAPEYCTSCTPNNNMLKDMGTGISLTACQAACDADRSCRFINVALPPENEACQLFSTCVDPSHQDGCSGQDW